MSIVEKIFLHSKNTPNSIAIINKNEKISYEKLSKDILIAASKLSNKGIKQLDYVLLSSPNTYQFICIYFALHFIGARVINAAPDSNDSYLSFIIKKIEPVLCIKDCKSFLNENNALTTLNFTDAKIDEEAIADILFTSGTTGKPKGVSLTHKQIMVATEHIVNYVKNTKDDIEILLMPLSHSFGMGRMRSIFFMGGTLVIGYPLQRLKSVFNAMKEHSITGIGLVPSAWNFITNLSKDKIKNFSSQLNYIEFGSAHMPSKEKQLIVDWFPDTNLVMHYGLTEVSRAIFLNFHTDNLESAGSINNGSEVLILNNDEKEIKNEEIGQILFKAPWMISSYFQDKKLDKVSFFNGYIKTGDIGMIKSGYLFLTGRLDEIINVGGKKVSPIMVEDVINNFKVVKECACMALSDANMGEVVQVFIVLEDGIEEEFEKIILKMKDYIQEKLSVHMRPQKYNLVKSLPKTANGKIQKSKVDTLEVQISC